jgi:hypothetical protein
MCVALFLSSPNHALYQRTGLVAGPARYDYRGPIVTCAGPSLTPGLAVLTGCAVAIV